MNYEERVKALRYCVNARNCEKCGFRINNNSVKCRIQRVEQAAAAIEELQAELEKKRTADCWGCKCEKMEPKRGEWELIDGAEPMRWGCSRCKYLSWETSNYCPRCGAKMEVRNE